MSKIINYIRTTNHLNPHNFRVYFIVGLVFSSIQFLSNFFSDYTTDGLLTILKGDVIDYIELSENFLEYGFYGSEGQPSAYRMPGFAMFYIPFRIILSKNMAINSLIVFQIIFSVLAKYYFSKIIYGVTKSRKMFLISFIFLTIAPPLIFFNNILYTESIASSCVMMFIYQLYLFDFNKEKKHLLLSGLFLSMSIFLRPFLGVFIPFTITLLFIRNRNKINLNLFKFSFIFLSTFLIMESCWIIRNYAVFDRFIPLETSIEGTYCESSHCDWRKLVIRTGESNVYWDNSTVGTWFAHSEFLSKHSIQRPSDDILPKILFTKYLTIDTLKKARDLSNREINDGSTALESEIEAKRIFKMFDDSLKMNHPFTYYFYSRVTPLIDTFYQKKSPTKNLKYPLNILTVGFNVFMCAFLLLFGIFSVTYLLILEKDIFIRLLLAATLTLVLLMDSLFMEHENRYITLVFSVLVFASILFYQRLNKKKLIIIPFLIYALIISILEIYSMYSNA